MPRKKKEPKFITIEEYAAKYRRDVEEVKYLVLLDDSSGIRRYRTNPRNPEMCAITVSGYLDKSTDTFIKDFSVPMTVNSFINMKDIRIENLNGGNTERLKDDRFKSMPTNESLNDKGDYQHGLRK